MSSRQVIRQLKADGWALVHVKGSHHQFEHAVKPGRVAVAHPAKDIPKGTLASIERQARITFRR